MHILPKGFVKIRYYGILSNRYSKQTAMYRKPQIQIPNETPEQRMFRLTGMDIYQFRFVKMARCIRLKLFLEYVRLIYFLDLAPRI